MNKRLILALVMMVVLMTGLVAGCAAPTAPGAPAKTVTTTATKTITSTITTPKTITSTVTAPASKEVMKAQQWDCIIYWTSVTSFHDVEKQKAFDRIKERTGGLLDIRSVGMGGLPIKAEDLLRAVATGELAMCEASGGYHSGDYPMLGIIDVPYIYTNKLEKRMVYEACRPIWQREFHKEGIHMLSYRPGFTLALATNKPVDVMDLKGTKIRSYSLGSAKIIEAMGGTAVPIAWAEVYSALEKGVADGLITGADAILSTKICDVAPYSYATGPLHGSLFITVNLELWESLPKDVQNIVHEELSQWVGLDLIWSEKEIPRVFDLIEEETGIATVWPAQEFFDTMTEKVAKPFMVEELEKVGEPLATEILTAIEQALGRSLH